MRIICIHIIAENLLGEHAQKALGKKKMVECKLKMLEVETFLWECPLGHRRYYPAYKSELKSKLTAPTIDGGVAYLP